MNTVPIIRAIRSTIGLLWTVVRPLTLRLQVMPKLTGAFPVALGCTLIGRRLRGSCNFYCSITRTSTPVLVDDGKLGVWFAAGVLPLSGFRHVSPEICIVSLRRLGGVYNRYLITVEELIEQRLDRHRLMINCRLDSQLAQRSCSPDSHPLSVVHICLGRIVFLLHPLRRAFQGFLIHDKRMRFTPCLRLELLRCALDLLLIGRRGACGHDIAKASHNVVATPLRRNLHLHLMHLKNRRPSFGSCAVA